MIAKFNFISFWKNMSIWFAIYNASIWNASNRRVQKCVLCHSLTRIYYQYRTLQSFLGRLWGGLGDMALWGGKIVAFPQARGMTLICFSHFPQNSSPHPLTMVHHGQLSEMAWILREYGTENFITNITINYFGCSIKIYGI